MVDIPQTSGVLFTINPITGHPGEMMINANYGLGEVGNESNYLTIFSTEIKVDRFI